MQFFVLSEITFTHTCALPFDLYLLAPTGIMKGASTTGDSVDEQLAITTASEGTNH
jgi:hypothetical protein